MKVCPQCNEKFDEDINFCLNDGSVLVDESIHKEATAVKTDEFGKTEETVIKKDLAKPRKPHGSSKFTKIVLAALVLTMVFGGLGFAFLNTGSFISSASHDIPTKISKEEMELLISDFNPLQLKQLSENPQQKEDLIKNLKELLAVANQAQKENLIKDEALQIDLDEVDKSILALNYDKKLNTENAPMPPFSKITEDQVKKYWEATDAEQGIFEKIGLGEGTAKEREQKFQKFIDAKIAAARKSGQMTAEQTPSEEELKQARDAYAKIQIYYREAKQKLDNLNSLPEAEKKEWETFKKKADLQTKLQKAQLLAQRYSQEVLDKKLEVTDAEIEEYTKQNPALTNTDEKRKKAEEILAKVKNGEDFAKLAKEHSEDPGSKDQGGLYEGVGKGQFAPEFEVAALSLKPGEVTKELVKTNFGFHIIKLIKKGEAKGQDGQVQPTYDVRHILISTMVKDPENPAGREMPVKDFVKAKLEKEKQEKVINEILANNPIEVAADFEIPKVSDEEIKKLEEEQKKRLEEMQKQMTPPSAKSDGDNTNTETEEKPEK